MIEERDVLEKEHTFICRLQDTGYDISSDNISSDQHNPEGCAGQDQKQKRKNRNEKRAKASDPLPKKISIISQKDWINAISFQKNKYAYMYQKDDSKELPEIQTLRYLYGGFMMKYPIDLETEDVDQIPDGWIDSTLTIYLTKYIDWIGVKKNHGRTSEQAIINKISGYADNLVGVVREEEYGEVIYKEYPVIKDFVYDDNDKTITFSSPYMMMIIRKVESSRIRRNKKGEPIRYKNGKLALSAVYSYRLDPKILHESADRAVEVTGIIATLIDRAGSPDKNKDKVANISYMGIMNRYEKLKREYEATSSHNKKRTLERVFRKTWEFLLKYTDLKSAYKNIKLPDPKDKDFEKYIPTTKSLNEVLRFPHDEKRRGK